MKKEAKQKDEKPAANALREKKPTKLDTEQALLENFVSLQRVLTNLSIKFDSLSDNISKLLQLFEISAKGFIGKQGIKEIDKEKSVEREELNFQKGIRCRNFHKGSPNFHSREKLSLN